MTVPEVTLTLPEGTLTSPVEAVRDVPVITSPVISSTTKSWFIVKLSTVKVVIALGVGDKLCIDPALTAPEKFAEVPSIDPVEPLIVMLPEAETSPIDESIFPELATIFPELVWMFPEAVTISPALLDMSPVEVTEAAESVEKSAVLLEFNKWLDKAPTVVLNPSSVVSSLVTVRELSVILSLDVSSLINLIGIKPPFFYVNFNIETSILSTVTILPARKGAEAPVKSSLNL